MINVFWVRRRRYIAGMYRDNLRDTAAQEGPVLSIIYHYHYHRPHVARVAQLGRCQCPAIRRHRQPDLFEIAS
jgi:hypothetical protein